ncbi:hypothetical protein QUF61_11845 [Candidatus Venteria ishoeyi]|uniref:hypothetical protein n=1 Tax=Candidatus Venteria ishoeyi TaxID=1899563 RepID=UPI0025A64728|nr:hypothetical protein [Candidatus Venteria ishoeyi]MDM8547178.1 hypothetical protein [Candidatus Venteria ishoeyi]
MIKHKYLLMIAVFGTSALPELVSAFNFGDMMPFFSNNNNNNRDDYEQQYGYPPHPGGPYGWGGPGAYPPAAYGQPYAPPGYAHWPQPPQPQGAGSRPNSNTAGQGSNNPYAPPPPPPVMDNDNNATITRQHTISGRPGNQQHSYSYSYNYSRQNPAQPLVRGMEGGRSSGTKPLSNAEAPAYKPGERPAPDSFRSHRGGRSGMGMGAPDSRSSYSRNYSGSGSGMGSGSRSGYSRNDGGMRSFQPYPPAYPGHQGGMEPSRFPAKQDPRSSDNAGNAPPASYYAGPGYAQSGPPAQRTQPPQSPTSSRTNTPKKVLNPNTGQVEYDYKPPASGVYNAPTGSQYAPPAGSAFVPEQTYPGQYQ